MTNDECLMTNQRRMTKEEALLQSPDSLPRQLQERVVLPGPENRRAPILVFVSRWYKGVGGVENRRKRRFWGRNHYRVLKGRPHPDPLPRDTRVMTNVECLMTNQCRMKKEESVVRNCGRRSPRRGWGWRTVAVMLAPS
jgi:hypothetical protein